VAIKIFVSYSHKDADFMAEDSLIGFLKGLESEGVEFWWDERILTGDKWDDEIKRRIKETDIALVLISQWYLDSAYCNNVEICGFLEKCRSHGLVVFPIIISSCEWDRHEWLKTRQFLPIGQKTVRKDFPDRGSREQLFLQIRKDLRKQINRINLTRIATDDLNELTEMSDVVVKGADSLLSKELTGRSDTVAKGWEKEVTDALLNLLIEFSNTHSEIVNHVEPIMTLTRDPKQFGSDFQKSYIDYRQFRFGDSLKEAQTLCSLVELHWIKLESSVLALKTSSRKGLQALEKAFKKLADYDYVINIWKSIFSLIDSYSGEVNKCLASGMVSEAISLMDSCRNSVDASYRESLEALDNMNKLIQKIKTMYFKLG
jgi:hypothetical protein